MINQSEMNEILNQYLETDCIGEYREYTEYHETWRDEDDL